MFRSKASKKKTNGYSSEPKTDEEIVTPPHQATDGERDGHGKHMYKRQGQRMPREIAKEGESGRKGFNPIQFFTICFRSTSRMSMFVNVLWPVVPAAIAVHFAIPDSHLIIFILNYIAMVPAANLIGFAGQEFARKIPKVLGILVETTLGSVVEIVLFMALLVIGRRQARERGDPSVNLNIPVIRAAILGSILANLLLCLGLCFIAGGFQREEQVFHEVISEVGSGLLFVAGVGLVIPAIFATVTGGVGVNEAGNIINEDLERRVLSISRATAIILLIAYGVYVFFQMSSHHGLYDEVLEADEQRDEDAHKDKRKKKLTMTECIIALLIAIACVSLIAVFLVLEIEFIVEDRGVSDAFMGLILVPLVEKAAEHLTAIDEAYDNQANFALVHVLGACVQTALLNTPLVVIVGWGLHEAMDLNFKQFEAIVLILAIIAVGNFLRDGKSNYLEGALMVFVYIIIAIAAFYYPNPAEEAAASEGGSHGEASGESGGEPAAEPTAHAVAREASKLVMRTLVG